MKQTVTRFALGIAMSLAVHAALFSVVSIFFISVSDHAKDNADALPQLDVTRVDLSFSEEEQDVAPPSLSQPAAPAEERTLQPQNPLQQLPSPEPLTVQDDDAFVDVKVFENVNESELIPPELDPPESQLSQKPVEEKFIQEMPDDSSEEKPQENKSENENVSPADSAQASVPAPKQAHVDAPPEPRRTITPKYPQGARKRGEEGSVNLELDIDIRGVVVNVKVVGGCGFAELEEAAMSAVRKAVFRPGKRDGKPVSSRARLTLEFRLKR